MPEQAVNDKQVVQLGRLVTGVLTTLTAAVILGGYSMAMKVDRATTELTRVVGHLEKLEVRLSAQDGVQRQYGERLRVVETRVEDLWGRR